MLCPKPPHVQGPSISLKELKHQLDSVRRIQESEAKAKNARLTPLIPRLAMDTTNGQQVTMRQLKQTCIRGDSIDSPNSTNFFLKNLFDTQKLLYPPPSMVPPNLFVSKLDVEIPANNVGIIDGETGFFDVQTFPSPPMDGGSFTSSNDAEVNGSNANFRREVFAISGALDAMMNEAHYVPDQFPSEADADVGHHVLQELQYLAVAINECARVSYPLCKHFAALLTTVSQRMSTMDNKLNNLVNHMDSKARSSHEEAIRARQKHAQLAEQLQQANKELEMSKLIVAVDQSPREKFRQHLRAMKREQEDEMEKKRVAATQRRQAIEQVQVVNGEVDDLPSLALGKEENPYDKETNHISKDEVDAMKLRLEALEKQEGKIKTKSDIYKPDRERIRRKREELQTSVTFRHPVEMKDKCVDCADIFFDMNGRFSRPSIASVASKITECIRERSMKEAMRIRSEVNTNRPGSIPLGEKLIRDQKRQEEEASRKTKKKMRKESQVKNKKHRAKKEHGNEASYPLASPKEGSFDQTFVSEGSDNEFLMTTDKEVRAESATAEHSEKNQEDVPENAVDAEVQTDEMEKEVLIKKRIVFFNPSKMFGPSTESPNSATVKSPNYTLTNAEEATDLGYDINLVSIGVNTIESAIAAERAAIHGEKYSTADPDEIKPLSKDQNMVLDGKLLPECFLTPLHVAGGLPKLVGAARPHSTKWINCTLYEIYRHVDPTKMDLNEGSYDASLAAFTFSFFKAKYGLENMAVKYLVDLLVNCQLQVDAPDSLRIELFVQWSELTQFVQVKNWHLSKMSLAFYILCLHLVSRISNFRMQSELENGELMLGMTQIHQILPWLFTDVLFTPLGLDPEAERSALLEQLLKGTSMEEEVKVDEMLYKFVRNYAVIEAVIDRANEAGIDVETVIPWAILA